MAFDKVHRYDPADPRFTPADPKLDPRNPVIDPAEPQFDPPLPKLDKDPVLDPTQPQFDKNPVIDNTPGTRYHFGENPELEELVPTIWPFKAEWIEFVGDDRLPEWEEMTRTKVGLPDLGRMSFKPGCPTTSGSGDGWDDSDYWGNGC